MGRVKRIGEKAELSTTERGSTRLYGGERDVVCSLYKYINEIIIMVDLHNCEQQAEE